MQYIYLHGFASSPKSYKVQGISSRFAQHKISLEVPDLNAGDFSHLTITRQIKQVVSGFHDISTPITLIGSSLGGLTAAHIGQQHIQVQRLILLAPAFGFLSHWLPKLGDAKIQLWQEKKFLNIYHYGEDQEIPLHYDFVTDAAQYHEEILQRQIPTLVLHGLHDDVIPIDASREFAAKRPWVKLIELDSDHLLGDVIPKIWDEISTFCHLP